MNDLQKFEFTWMLKNAAMFLAGAMFAALFVWAMFRLASRLEFRLQAVRPEPVFDASPRGILIEFAKTALLVAAILAALSGAWFAVGIILKRN